MAWVSLLLLADLYTETAAQNLRLSNEARELAVLRGAAKEGGLDSDALAWIDLPGVCTLETPFPVLHLIPVRFAARARVRAYIGYDSGDFGSISDQEGPDSLVYVTDYESVYHTDPSCTHLDLTVFTSDTDHIGDLRNEYGDRYKPCDGFPKDYSGTVYLTAKGDRYYPSPDFAGLHRHVRAVDPDDVPHLTECERCRERHKDAAA